MSPLDTSCARCASMSLSRFRNVSGLTCLVDDRAWFPVRILRGVGPRGRATGDVLPPRLSGFGIGYSKNTRSPSPPSELLRLERGCDPGDRRPIRGEGGW